MKNRILRLIALPLLAVGITFNVQAAAVCIAPSPLCATVLLGGLVTGSVASNGDREFRHLRVGTDVDALASIVERIQRIDDERLVVRIEQAARYRPGFGSIVHRFENDRFDGRMSLQSLMEFDPQLFEDLDRIEAVIGQHYAPETMAETYGPHYLDDGAVNWERYAILAREALAIHHNLFVEHRADSRSHDARGEPVDRLTRTAVLPTRGRP